mgnify:CR=1 FL=1
MQIQIEGKFLSAESKAYNVDGNEGTSHRVRLATSEGDIYPFKSNQEQVALLNSKFKKGDEVTALVSVDSRKEAVSLSLVSVDPL